MTVEIVDKVLEYDGPVVCDVVCDEFHKVRTKDFWLRKSNGRYAHICSK